MIFTYFQLDRYEVSNFPEIVLEPKSVTNAPMHSSILFTLLFTYYPPVSSVGAPSSNCPEHDSQLCGVGGVSHPPDGGRQAY